MSGPLVPLWIRACLTSQSTFFQSCQEGYPGLNQYLGEDNMSCSRVQRGASSESKIAAPRSRVKHLTTDPPRSGADPGFMERGRSYV